MISRIYMICDAYESGMGHGLKQDGHANLDKNLYGGAGSDELNEAYSIGYKEGVKRAAVSKDNCKVSSLERRA